MRRAMLSLGVAVLLSACNSAPVDLASAPPVPAERIYDMQLVQPGTEKVQVTVARDRGFVGGGCNTAVYWNGKKVAAIHQGEFIELHVMPGRHVLGHGPNPEGSGLCKYGSESARRETEVVVELGQPLKYRLAISANGESSIMRTAF